MAPSEYLLGQIRNNRRVWVREALRLTCRRAGRWTCTHASSTWKRCEEYRRASKNEKGRILSEARKRTRLNRKVLIRKLAHPRPAGTVRRRGVSYGAEVVTALAQVWELFDFACGQRLAAALRTEVPRLREAGELKCSDVIAAKLMQIAPKIIDWQHEKQVHRGNRVGW